MAATIQRLKSSGVRLSLFIENTPELPTDDREALFTTIGEIAYISEGLLLAGPGQAGVDEKLATLTKNAEVVCDLVDIVVAKH